MERHLTAAPRQWIITSILALQQSIMKFSTVFRFTLTALTLSSLIQCVPSTGGSSQYLAGYGTGATAQGNTPGYSPQGYWDGDDVQGTAKIRIVRAEQKAYFYKGGKLVGMSPISSGDESHGTPRGNFKVTQKSKNHASSLYGVIKNRATGEVINKDADTRKHRAGPGEVFVHAPMPNFLRFNGAIGMHTGYLPGYAASHGCVRLPEFMAAKFFEHASHGTPVIVE